MKKKMNERIIMWPESFIQKTGFEVGIYTLFLGNGDFSIKCFIQTKLGQEFVYKTRDTKFWSNYLYPPTN